MDFTEALNETLFDDFAAAADHSLSLSATFAKEQTGESGKAAYAALEGVDAIAVLVRKVPLSPHDEKWNGFASRLAAVTAAYQNAHQRFFARFTPG